VVDDVVDGTLEVAGQVLMFEQDAARR